MKMRGWASTATSSNKGDSGLGGPPGGNGTFPKGAAVPRNGPSSICSSLKSNDSGVPQPDISREQSPDDRLPRVSLAGARSPAPPAASAGARRSEPMAPPRPSMASGGYRHSSNSTGSSTGGGHPYGITVDVPSKDQSAFLNETGMTNMSMSKSLDERLREAEEPSVRGQSPLTPSDYTIFTAQLRKDPRVGLGLTLVDGEIQGMKGVYVKSLTSDGPAESQGKMRQGDKILSINGESLDGKNRHDAVNLVKNSGSEVEMDILRLKGLYGSGEDEDSAATATASVTDSSAPSGVGSTAAKARARSKSNMSDYGIGMDHS